MKNSTLQTLGLLWLRILMGAGIMRHGGEKLFGSGGVSGFAHTVAGMGYPYSTFLAWAAVLSEFMGGVCIVIGFCTRFAALMIFGTMTVAIFEFHKNDALQTREMALAYWTMAMAIALLGPGSISLDRYVWGKGGGGSGGGGGGHGGKKD